MRTAPTAPLAMISRVRRIGASKLWLWPTTRRTLARFGRIDHLRAFGERDRHRLFDQHVLAVRRGQRNVLRVMLVRRGDVDHVDGRVRAQASRDESGSRAEIRRELFARLGARVGAPRPARCADRATNVGSISVNARPSPATPRRKTRTARSPIDDQFVRAGARDADHDVSARARRRRARDRDDRPRRR